MFDMLSLRQHYSTSLIRCFNLTLITAALCGAIATKPMLLQNRVVRVLTYSGNSF